MSTASERFPGWRPTFAEVDLRAFDRNVDAILRRLPAESKMVAVLKADGYGHGAAALAKRCESRSVAIAVAILEEAVELRRAGVRAPILVLGPLTAPQFDLMFEHTLTPGIVGPEELAAFARRAEATGWSGGIHLKLDSGMGRMGFVAGDLEALAATLSRLPRVRVEGIYTHFANASDPEDRYTQTQLERFEQMRARLETLGVAAPRSEEHTSELQ